MYIYNYLHIGRAARYVKNPPANNYDWEVSKLSLQQWIQPSAVDLINLHLHKVNLGVSMLFRSIHTISKLGKEYHIRIKSYSDTRNKREYIVSNS